MKFRIILFSILGFFLFSNLTYSHAVRWTAAMEEDDDGGDTTHRPNADSLREAHAHYTDSIRDERTRIADSTTLARKHKTDSTQRIRKHITDSTTAIRKYRDSKHYKDSVTHVRTKKTNALKALRQAHMDSVKDARKTRTDSMTAARKERTDSVKTIQKRRSDSLAKIKKYKTSKRYADSVSIVKHNRADSIEAAHKSFRDHMASVRKHSLDSATKVRKHRTDSMTAFRKKRMDSIAMVRKHRTDSLAKEKKKKEELAKAKEKKKEDAMKFKLELKMKQKHEAWSNKSMLKKRWSPMRRFLQNSFTHYNYYYNAKKKMDEALVNMQRQRKENYDSLIGLYPFDPNRDSGMLAQDMDTIARKISVGIQIHDPRVKWSNDLYLLLGEAYYYRGRYDNASTSFRYIISKDEEKKKKDAGPGYAGASKSKDEPSIIEEEKKSRLEFLKHKSVHNEAILWLARTYTEAHEAENAESVLSLLESDNKFPEDLKGRLAIEKAFAYLRENNRPLASTQLAIAADDNNLPYWLRMRAAFLNGQLLQNMGDYKEAAGSFEKVLTYYPKIDMDFYSRKYIAYNLLENGEDVDDATKPLKRVLNDGKYVNYYDQVYYVLGNLAVKASNNGKAITYYTKSTTTPKATKKQKALSFAALGDVYYSSSNYPAAKRAYDSASKYSSAASKDNTVIAALQKNKGLEEIAGPSKVIHEQDSLMELSELSKKEQQATVRRYLRLLEEMHDDSATNATTIAAAPAVAAETDEGSSDAANWYFGNTVLMQQGSADFKRKWGNRPLTDNWRRSSGNALTNNSDDEDEEAAAGSSENGLPTEESLLAKIPNSPQQKELSAKIEQRAYILLAKAYIKQLEDYNQATYTLDTLDSRFPNHNQKEEELYLRYQIAIKQNKLDKAQQYSQELQTKFPESEYASMLRPRKSESKSKMEANTTGKTASAYFDETYSLLMQHQYTEALMHVDIAKRQFDDPSYKKRFEVAEAMGYAGTGDYKMADSVITGFLHSHPADTLTPWASTVKEYIKEVRNGGKPSWYKETPPGLATTDTGKSATRTKLPTPVIAKTTPPPPKEVIPERYAYQADSGHYCIIVLPGLDSKTAGLKQAIKSLNSGKYADANLDMLLDLYNIDQGVLVIKKFANATLAKNYMNDLMASDAFNGYSPGELTPMVISAANYKKMFSDKNAQPYYSFYSTYYGR